jgi:ketosteroid isomerase-like protein
MSQENVEIARWVVESNTSDADQALVEEILSVIHPAFEFVSSMGAVDQQVYHGPDGIRKYRADMEEAWVKWHMEVEDAFEPRPGVVIVVQRVHLVARESEMSLEGQRAVVFELAEGMLVRADAYAGRQEALDAVGVPE